MFRLDGKTAPVTGAATGLGQAIAVGLARQGANIILSDKPESSLAQSDRELVNASVAKAICVPIDVRDLSQVERGAASAGANGACRYSG